jgi:Tfp pilus assembly protein PilF
MLLGCGGAAKPVEAPASAPAASASAAPAAEVLPGEDARAGSDVPPEARSAYGRGYKLFQEGDLPGARKAFEEAVQKAPRAAATHLALGQTLERLGDASGAMQAYRAGLSGQSDHEPTIGAVALLLSAEGRLGEAESFLNERRTRLPKSARVLAYLSEVKSRQQDSASAQLHAQDALKLDPNCREAMVALARDHYRARRVELARYALQAILDGFGTETPPRDNGNPEACLLRGIVEREAGRRIAAMDAFECALKRRPEMVEALVQLGAMRLEAGNGKEALAPLERAVKFAPKDAQAHLHLGDAYRLVGRPDDARKELEAALALDKALVVAHYDLGLLFLFAPKISGMSESDQAAAAIKAFETYKSTRPALGRTSKGDDLDELINRAKAKQADIKNRAAAAAAAPSAGAPAAAAPAPSSSAPAPAGGKK